MFKEDLESIKAKLKLQEPFQDSSFIFDRYEDNSLNFQGITDEYPTYAYLEVVEDKNGRTYRFNQLGDCYRYSVAARVKLIAGFKCADIPKAVRVLTNIVAGKDTRIIDVSTKAELIYKDETKQDLRRDDIVLIRVYFDIEKIYIINNCETLECNDGCCS